MLELRLVSALAKVFPNNAPPATNDDNWLSALTNETVSLQAAYLYKNGCIRSWAVLKIEAPAEIEFTLRRVQYIPGSIPSHFKTDEGYISTDAGLFPDLLEPYKGTTKTGTNRLPLVPGIWQSCWIDVKFKANASAGCYPLKISIEKSNGEVLSTAETSIEYISINLPKLHIPRTQWFHTDCLAEYYNVEAFSERHWQIIENFASFAVDHGINTLLTPIHTPPLDTEIGNERLTVQLIDVTQHGKIYEFGFEKFERWVAMCKRIGVEYYEMAHLFTQWGAKHAPKIVDTNGNQLFGWETDAVGDAYKNYLSQMLPALTIKLDQLGIAKKTIFHISDEPENEEHAKAYVKAREAVISLLKGYKIADALTNYDSYKQNEHEIIPIAAIDHITPFLESGAMELWCYYCCAQSYKVPNHFFMLPSYRNRVLGVLMYKYNMDGFLHWAYNFYKCIHSVYPIDPFRTTDADGTYPSGDAFVVYPGKDGKPLASLRLMVAQHAFNDLRALKLLEAKIGRDAVVELIDRGLDTQITFTDFPQNEAYLLNLRQQVNSLIKKTS